VTVADALARYADEAGPKRAAIVKRFIEAEGWHAEAGSALSRHLRTLQARGLRPGTVDLAYRTIRAFYRRVGLPAPRVAGYRYDPEDARRYALAPDAIAAMIDGARSGRTQPLDTAYLALSTVYGMRAVEMARVQARDIDRAGERIYLRTAKGGPSRWIWLPPPIASVLPDRWPVGDERDLTARVEASFAHVWDAAIDAERPRGVAWHAIRRALHRDLAAQGVPEPDRKRFGRWSASRGMAERYAAPNLTVGLERVEPARLAEEGTPEHDAAVWQHHPYLGLWA